MIFCIAAMVNKIYSRFSQCVKGTLLSHMRLMALDALAKPVFYETAYF